MPDRRKHRGRHPDDERLFAREFHAALRSAVADFSWLLTHDYADASALKLVGDRYGLTARQRTAVQRSSCSDASLERRRSTMVELSAAPQGASDVVSRGRLGIDGYNVLITVESALAGGLILIGRDGCCRDLASIHGTYRKVEETIPALTLIVDYREQRLASHAALRHIDFYLDRPVANSGRLKALLAELLEQRRADGSLCNHSEWDIELHPRPDGLLTAYDGVVATSDSIILDQCAAWTNLAGGIIPESVADAWIIDLRIP